MHTEFWIRFKTMLAKKDEFTRSRLGCAFLLRFSARMVLQSSLLNDLWYLRYRNGFGALKPLCCDLRPGLAEPSCLDPTLAVRCPFAMY